MASLQEIKQQLILNAKENTQGQDKMAAGLAGVASGINKLLALMKQSQLDMLEKMREKSSVPVVAPPATARSSDSSMLPPILGLGGLASAVTAIGASLTGVDDAIRAVGLAQLGKRLVTGFGILGKGAGDFLGSVKRIAGKFGDFGKNLSRIIFLPEEGVKALGQRIYKIFGLGVDGKPVAATSDAMKALYNPQKALANAIKPITTFFDDLVKPITTFFDDAAKPFKTFFTAASEGGPMKAIRGFFNGILDVGKFIPRIDFGALKAAIGSVDDATGLMGFFGSIFNFLKPLMKPFEFILKTALRPFTQILLSLVDFVVGFYKGFTSEGGDFFQKLTAGIEGGIVGVIKGFTDAIDLILIKLPAWIMEKLGFQGLADNLREFSLSELVEPAWEGIKNFFKNLFNDPAGTLGSTITGAADMVNDFLKSVLRSILPTPDPNGNWYDPANLVSKAIPNSVYQYAGIDKDTGELIKKIDPSASLNSRGSGEFIDTGGGKRAPSSSVNVVDNSVSSSSSSSNPIIIGNVKTNDAQDPMTRHKQGLGF